MSNQAPEFPGSEYRVDDETREDIGYKPANPETTEALKEIAKNNLAEQRAVEVKKTKAIQQAHRAKNAGEELTPEQEQLLAELINDSAQ